MPHQSSPLSGLKRRSPSSDATMRQQTVHVSSIDSSASNKSRKSSSPHNTRKPEWSTEEDNVIIHTITSSSDQTFTKWSKLSKQLPNRTGKQIRDHWMNYLNPAIIHGPFSREDDLFLWSGVKRYKKKWVQLAEVVFKGTRSENQIKNRWNGASFRKFIDEEFGESAYIAVHVDWGVDGDVVAAGINDDSRANGMNEGQNQGKKEASTIDKSSAEKASESSNSADGSDTNNNSYDQTTTDNKCDTGEKLNNTKYTSHIHVLTMGGTIDKDYPQLTAGYAFEFGDESAASRILKSHPNLGVSFEVKQICQKDSLDVDNIDREMLFGSIANLCTTDTSGERIRIVVTHGTDTMIESALYVQERLFRLNCDLSSVSIAFTGATKPERFVDSDASFNVGCAVGATSCVEGVFICMNGNVTKATNCARDKCSGLFELSCSIQSPNL